MIYLALIPALAILLALGAYIRFWLGKMLPSRNKILRAVLTIALTLGSVWIFSTAGMVLLHFWLISMLWEIPMKLTKKSSNLLRIAVPLALTLAVAGLGMYNISTPIQTNYVYETEKPIRQEGYRVVLITDTHYDTIQNPQVLMDAIPRINALNPDFVVLCGDIVEEGTSKARMEEVFQVLGGLESSLGTYYIFGNHDRQAYSRAPKYTVAELRNAIEGNGITILKSEYITLNDEIILAGMEDPSWHRDDPRVPAAQVLDGADLSKLVIVADHQPNDWKAGSAAGMDLQLSGHTHAGQIFPVGLFLELVGGLSYGRYDRDGCTAIVSSGFAGWGFTIRTSERSEFVVIDIVNGSEAHP